MTTELKESKLQQNHNKPHSGKPTLDYEKILATPEFKKLVKKKNRFITPYTIAFFAIYLLLPILTGYTKILEARAVGWMTWTWVYAFGLFVMVWAFTQIYVRKARDFDKYVDQIVEKHVRN